MSMMWESFAGSWSGTITFDWAPGKNPELIAHQADQAAANVNDMTRPLHAARELAISEVEERFDSKHGPGGAAWAPWARSYADYAAAHNVGGLLEQTGAMRAAATARSNYPVTTREVFFTMDSPFYWIYHQEGAERESRGRTEADVAEMTAAGVDFTKNILPARPFIGVDEETQLAIIDLFDAWFGDAISILVYGSRGGYTRTVKRDPGGKFLPNE